MATHRHLEVTEVGDVTVVRLTDRKVVDETNIQELERPRAIRPGRGRKPQDRC